MARKRMIDPGIWRDSNVIKLSNDEFIVWVGCISTADDEGIIEPDPDSLYFELARKELTPEIIASALKTLSELEMIIRYDRFAFLPHWFKHQTLNRPSPTKLTRPPRSIVERYQDYISAWESTYSYYTGKGDEKRLVEASYPYREDDTPLSDEENSPLNDVIPLSDDSVIPHEQVSELPTETDEEAKLHQKETGNVQNNGKKEVFTEDSLNDHEQLSANRMEEKGKEEKRTRTRPRKRAGPPEKPHPVYHAIKETYESKWPDDTLPNYAREGPALKAFTQEALKRSHGDPYVWAKTACENHWRLKKDPESLFHRHPFLPSIAMSSGLFPRLLEAMHPMTPELSDRDRRKLAALGAER